MSREGRRAIAKSVPQFVLVDATELAVLRRLADASKRMITQCAVSIARTRAEADFLRVRSEIASDLRILESLRPNAG